MPGKLIIFSAPSGSGKTTIVKHLLKSIPETAFSISACTREMRDGEQSGREYYFISEVEFRERIANSEFVEYEEVYPGHFYGTLKAEIERLLNKGKHVLFDIDVEGGLNIKKQYGEQALAVFVKPKSLEVLKERLRSRKTESPEKQEMRIAKAIHELPYENQFDYILVNDDLQVAFVEAEKVVNAFVK
ncbi:MAG: guanylate kinase [Flavobacteriaceae bacterium]|nr:guanylate kinase [Flavobacteriaceae bacterium]